MTTEVFESVSDAPEVTPTGAENMKLRSSLMIAITEAVSAWHVTQTEAARHLGVTEPRLNDLLRGHVGKFSLDALGDSPLAPVLRFTWKSHWLRSNIAKEGSGGSGPKRHHFVPELLLKRFSDRDGRLFFFDHHRPELGVRRSTPKQLFNETHLYTEIGRDGVKDVSLERAFSALETRIEPLLERAVNAARANQTPRFSGREKGDWDKFLLLQWSVYQTYTKAFRRYEA